MLQQQGPAAAQNVRTASPQAHVVPPAYGYAAAPQAYGLIPAYYLIQWPAWPPA